MLETGRTPAAMRRFWTSHGEGPTVHAFDVATHEDRAQLGVGDLDAEVVGGAVAGLLDREVGPAQLAPRWPPRPRGPGPGC